MMDLTFDVYWDTEYLGVLCLRETHADEIEIVTVVNGELKKYLCSKPFVTHYTRTVIVGYTKNIIGSRPRERCWYVKT